MKKVYIVSDNTYIYGVHKTKKGAINTRQQARNHKWKGVFIKRRFNKLGYINIQE